MNTIQFRLFDNYEKSDSWNKNKVLYKRNTEGVSLINSKLVAKILKFIGKCDCLRQEGWKPEKMSK